MSEEKKKKGLLEKVAEFFEIEEVKEVAKPPAKTQEKPVHVPVEPPTGEVQPPEASAIEVKEPEPVEPPEIGEKGRRERIKIE